MARFGQKEKRAHYTGVAKGEIPVKKDSKISAAEQIAYAKGQRDARNEALRIFAYNNATPEQRAEHAAKRARERELRKAEMAAKGKK